MAQVTVTVNGQRYQLACRDGEEARLIGLAGYVDGKVGDLIEGIGNIGDTRLLLLAALVIADELMEARDSAMRAEDDEFTQRLAKAANRLEDIARRLESA
ncbi:MAG: cell division protein ZapA [Sphingomonadales bacterium]|nr:cell division protein ZapA [Sphingomonadales bacterium]